MTGCHPARPRSLDDERSHEEYVSDLRVISSSRPSCCIVKNRDMRKWSTLAERPQYSKNKSLCLISQEFILPQVRSGHNVHQVCNCVPSSYQISVCGKRKIDFGCKTRKSSIHKAKNMREVGDGPQICSAIVSYRFKAAESFTCNLTTPGPMDITMHVIGIITSPQVCCSRELEE